MLMFISLIWCYRLVKLKLKEKDDLFLTNSNGLLKLMPPDINNQTIRIHERKLTFVNFNKIYKFYLNNGSLEIKLRRVEEERHKIGFLRSGVRRKVKPFGFHSKRKMVPKDFVRSKNSEHDPPKKETVGVPREMVSSREITAREIMTSKEPVPKDPTPLVKELNKNNTKKEEFYSQDDPPEHDETEVDDDAKQIEILKSLISNLEGESEVKTSKPKVVQEKKEDNFMAKLKQIFKKKRLNEEVYIESDSKLEEDTVSEQFIDVIVSSINKTYFKLKTATGNCVTFMDNIFLFAPCINIDNQVFMTVNEEEVRRKMKESIALISYEKNMRNKYKTNCDDYYKLCNRGSPSYDETTCKQLREECEDESSDEESSRIIPERKPLPVYPFRRQETSKTDNFSIPSESVVRSSFFKPSPSLNSITLNNDPPPIVNQTSTVKTVTAIKSPPVTTTTQSTPQTTSSLRDIIKAEAGKKDFSPDDIIEKLKKSIKSNDISDILS